MKGKKQRYETKAVKDFVVSQIVGLLVMGAICGIGSLLIMNETLNPESEAHIVLISMIIAAYCAAILFVSRSKKNRLISCVVSGAGLFVLMIMMNALTFGASYSDIGPILVLILCGSGLALFPLRSRRGRSGVRKFRY